MPSTRLPNVYITQTFSGVSALAREVGLSQGYVSKLLGRGYSIEDIRDKAVRAEWRREIQAALRGETLVYRKSQRR